MKIKTVLCRGQTRGSCVAPHSFARGCVIIFVVTVDRECRFVFLVEGQRTRQFHKQPNQHSSLPALSRPEHHVPTQIHMQETGTAAREPTVSSMRIACMSDIEGDERFDRTDMESTKGRDVHFCSSARASCSTSRRSSQQQICST